MSSLFGVLSIARDGMLAHQAAIDTTGQNVANVSTPGYVRREALMSTRPIAGPGEGGVEVTGYVRRLDIFASGRLVDEEGRRGEVEVRAQAMASLEGLLGQGGAGLGVAVTDFFTSFTRLSSSPADPNLRREVLTRAEGLVRAFGNLSGGLKSARTELASRAQAESREANVALAELASLNGRIAEASSLGAEAGDLRDRRDVLVRDLGKSLGARAVEDQSGELTLFAAGVALVMGTSAATLEVGTDSDDALTVRAVRASGSSVDVTAGVDSGRLGGLVRVRENELPELSASLDQFAFDLAKAVNSVHEKGVGLDGVTGRPLFAVDLTAPGTAAALAVDGSVAGNPDAIAASTTAAGLPGGGDNAVALGRLFDMALASGATPGATYARFAGDVGARRLAADRDLAVREDTVAQAESMVGSVSGVSVDEEMVRLTQLQRAFEASTRVLRTVDQLLEGLMRDI